MMTPLARMPHALPGRTRIRIDEKRGDEAYFANVKEELEACPGVSGVETNSRTGSVLVRHTGDDVPIWDYAVGKGRFHRAGQKAGQNSSTPSLFAEKPSTVQGARSSGHTLVRNPQGAFIAVRSWRPVIFTCLVGIGVIQLIRGNIAFPALTAFWYALHLLPVPDRSTDVATTLREMVPPGRL